MPRNPASRSLTPAFLTRFEPRIPRTHIPGSDPREVSSIRPRRQKSQVYYGSLAKRFHIITPEEQADMYEDMLEEQSRNSGRRAADPSANMQAFRRQDGSYDVGASLQSEGAAEGQDE